MSTTDIKTVSATVVEQDQTNKKNLVQTVSATVVEQDQTPRKNLVQTVSATVVEQDQTPKKNLVKTVTATVVERNLGIKDALAQTFKEKEPDYIVENGTPYIRFEPGTNNKQLLYYPETDSDFYIVALRPNLIDFFENTQTFTGPTQVEVPHFNQLLIYDIGAGALDDITKANIKQTMLDRATGTGIDIDAGTANSVPGGLQDPYIPGVIGSEI